MLSVGKLTGGAEDYYLRSVADGAEEYYLGSGEAPGYWIGRGAAELALTGEVGADHLRAVLAARDPGSGEPLGIRETAGPRVAGFDFTFSAPKSASLLYGFAPPAISDKVRAAHDAAVAEGIGYLEDHGVFTRRGAGGAQRIATTGVVGAAFRHRTSRTGDPQLHTHVLVANAVKGADGRWSTLDSHAAHYHARTAGFLYEAVLRHELAQSLGVSFRPVVAGIAEIDGVDPEMLRAFSTRRTAILQRLDEWGTRSAKAAEIAALDTRPAKMRAGAGELSPGSSSLSDLWRDRARSLGFDPADLDTLVGPPRYLYLDDGLVFDVSDHLVSPQGLTAKVAGFERRDVVREVAAACPDGATSYVINHIAGLVMESPALVPLGRDGPGGEPRYTTADLLSIEARLRDTALRLTSTQTAAVSKETAAAVIVRRPTLSPEQADMVHHVTTSGDGVEVVIGVAGSGKTYALDAARSAWQAEGHSVYGIALSARAAGELADGAKVNATTVAMWELSIANGATSLRRGDVLIVDEAGMVGTRTLSRIVDSATESGAKVVLVGDDRQLPEIDAGGSFAALAHSLGATRLTANRRQFEIWERHALAQLRHGNVARAISAYDSAGRLHEGGNARRTKELLVEQWCDSYTSGNDARMYAARRGDVEELNNLARTELRSRGVLGADIVDMPRGVGFALGDEVMCLRNDRHLGVVNGTRGQVVDARDGALVVSTDSGVRTLPDAYLAEGHVTHGYASTIHKAQGATVDRAFVYGNASLFRESGYVAMSRARERTDLYVVTGSFETGIERAHGPEVIAPELVETLSVSRAKHTAESEMGDRECAPRRAPIDARSVEASSPHRVDGAIGPTDTASHHDSPDRAEVLVDDYRSRFGVTDGSPIGAAPADPNQRVAYDRVIEAMAEREMEREISMERDARQRHLGRGR